MSADESASGGTYAVCWNGGQRVTINGQDAGDFEAVHRQKTRLTFVAATDCPPSAAKAYRMSIDPHNGSSTGSPAGNVVVVENGVGRLVVDYTPPANGSKSIVFLRMHFAPEGLGYGYQIDGGRRSSATIPASSPHRCWSASWRRSQARLSEASSSVDGLRNVRTGRLRPDASVRKLSQASRDSIANRSPDSYRACTGAKLRR